MYFPAEAATRLVRLLVSFSRKVLRLWRCLRACRVPGLFRVLQPTAQNISAQLCIHARNDMKTHAWMATLSRLVDYAGRGFHQLETQDVDSHVTKWRSADAFMSYLRGDGGSSHRELSSFRTPTQQQKYVFHQYTTATTPFNGLDGQSYLGEGTPGVNGGGGSSESLTDSKIDQMSYQSSFFLGSSSN